MKTKLFLLKKFYIIANNANTVFNQSFLVIMSVTIYFVFISNARVILNLNDWGGKLINIFKISNGNNDAFILGNMRILSNSYLCKIGSIIVLNL